MLLLQLEQSLLSPLRHSFDPRREFVPSLHISFLLLQLSLGHLFDLALVSTPLRRRNAE